MTPDEIRSAAATLEVGARVRFTPTHGSGNRWWKLRARSDRFLLLTHAAPFSNRSELWYTVVDLTGWKQTYNGVGPGVARSSLNVLGGGWDCTTDASCAEAIAALESGKWELSYRRVAAVESIEIAPALAEVV